jgi:hypothetical protein
VLALHGTDKNDGSIQTKLLMHLKAMFPFGLEAISFMVIKMDYLVNLKNKTDYLWDLNGDFDHQIQIA